jgi:cytochrome c
LSAEWSLTLEVGRQFSHPKTAPNAVHKSRHRITHITAMLALAATALSPWAQAAPGVDEEAARALAKKSDCFKCHTVDQKKDGPAYREVAKKYRGKADAEAKLYTHVTTAPKVKIDGEEENHQIVKSKNDAEIYNLIRFILALPNP